MTNVSSNVYPSDKALRGGLAEATQLAQLIVASVADIVAEYQSAQKELPSLLAAEAGPFDAPHLQSSKLALAIQTVEAACAQLAYTVAPPAHVLTNKAFEYEEPTMLQVITSTKIADHLAGNPEGMHIDELSKLAGTDAKKLGRILRMLATKHCFQEVRPDVFAHNRISTPLVSTNPICALVSHITDECMRGTVRFPEIMRDPVRAASNAGEDTAFALAYGESLFEFYNAPAAEASRDRFAKSMVGWGEVSGGRAMLPKAYPWVHTPQDAMVCDIGGNNGHVALELIKAFPHLRVVVQDLPATVRLAHEYWTQEYPAAITSNRVKFVPLDFFAQSPVEKCDFYYIRHVLHDWPTSDCISILKNVRKVMAPSSRLLIHELVLQSAVHDPGYPKQIEAPKPLLANFGMSRVRAYYHDMNMLALCNSQQRTLREFVEMGEQAGFEFLKLWEAGESTLIEFQAA